MTNKSGFTMDTKSIAFNTISWLFGILFFATGTVNVFWGNDPGFGIFIVLLSLVYFPPLALLFKEKTGFRIPAVFKILLGIFILWAALGVGELFDKVDMMLMDFRS